ncbi:MAG: phenylacetate--CoA ligase, partial [Oscillospiraceae bacterium]|nr:phenylacetate--CoA ligase [Oscillospiraceae bacterium]
ALVHEKCSCGRTLVRMRKPVGRSDDMLIIRGVNVFPSQVEHVILEQGFEPNYQILVERKDNLDVMTVMVELSDATFSDSIRQIEAQEQRLRNAMLSTLGVSAGIKLVDPRSLPRSEGKAKRVIDKRGIIDYNVN